MKKFFLQLFTWWNGQTLGTRFHTWMHGNEVGMDEFGNKYFEKKDPNKKHSRRWVIYDKLSDASSIPPGWHAWIHHRSDLLPTQEDYIPYSWEKKHHPNLTGTAFAYYPKGSINRGGFRVKVKRDYVPWEPK